MRAAGEAGEQGFLHTAQGTNTRASHAWGNAQESAVLTQGTAPLPAMLETLLHLHCNSLHTHSCSIYLTFHIKNNIYIYRSCLHDVGLPVCSIFVLGIRC